MLLSDRHGCYYVIGMNVIERSPCVGICTGKVRTLKQHPRKNKTAINIEYMKARIRAKVEHPFRIIKRQFGFVKARYKGLQKNDNQLAMLFTLANLFRVDQMIRQWERSH